MEFRYTRIVDFGGDKVTSSPAVLTYTSVLYFHYLDGDTDLGPGQIQIGEVKLQIRREGGGIVARDILLTIFFTAGGIIRGHCKRVLISFLQRLST